MATEEDKAYHGPQIFLYKETNVFVPLVTYLSDRISTFQALPDDVVLASYGKNGTTWLKSLSLSILNFDKERDHLGDAAFIHVAVPTIDYTTTTDDGTYDGVQLANELEQRPRLYHCHLPYRAIAPDIKTKGCKMVYITRNIKDHVVSMASFAKLSATMGAFWAVPSDANAPLSTVVERIASDILAGRDLYGPFMRHVLDFWAAANDGDAPNRILFLHYEQLLSDYRAQVRRLADFIRPDERLTDADVELVCQRNEFATLKATQGSKAKGGESHAGFTPDVFFVKGQAGRWRRDMSEETAERLDRFAREAVKGTDYYPWHLIYSSSFPTWLCLRGSPE